MMPGSSDCNGKVPCAVLLQIHRAKFRFGPKADKHGHGLIVRFVPIADIACPCTVAIREPTDAYGRKEFGRPLHNF